MRELGDRVTHLLVDRSRHVAPVTMRNRDPEVNRCDGCGEHLAAVSQEEDNVRREALEGIGDSEDCDANPLRHRGLTIRGEQHVHAGPNGEPALFDETPRASKVWDTVHSRNEQGKFKLRVCINALQHMLGKAEVRTCARDINDATSTHRSSHCMTLPAFRSRRRTRPTTNGTWSGEMPVPGRRLSSSSGRSTVPATESLVMTKLRRAVRAISLSTGAGLFRPSPRAISICRTPSTRAHSSLGSSDAA